MNMMDELEALTRLSLLRRNLSDIYGGRERRRQGHGSAVTLENGAPATMSMQHMRVNAKKRQQTQGECHERRCHACTHSRPVFLPTISAISS
jgi:hypothetical protein